MDKFTEEDKWQAFAGAMTGALLGILIAAPLCSDTLRIANLILAIITAG